jgi:hypothetical protein
MYAVEVKQYDNYRERRSIPSRVEYRRPLNEAQSKAKKNQSWSSKQRAPKAAPKADESKVTSVTGIIVSNVDLSAGDRFCSAAP